MTLLHPIEEEIQWWEEAQDAAEEAEAVHQWLAEHIARIQEAVEQYPEAYEHEPTRELISNLVQVRDSLAYAWGFNLPLSGPVPY